MEEVDAIILRSLQGIGWKASVPVTSLDDVPPKDFFSAAVICLESLVEGFSVRRPFPSQTPAVVRIAVDLCNKVKELGFRGEVAYQQLVYPAVQENRRLLSWLVGQLPNEGGEEGGGVGGEDGGDIPSSVLLQKKARGGLESLLRQDWLPAFILSPPFPSSRKPSSSPSSSSSSSSFSPSVRIKEVHPVCSGTLSPFGIHRAERAIQPIVDAYSRTEMKFLTLQPSRKENLVGTLIETSAAIVSLRTDEEADWATNGMGQARNPWDYNNKKRKMIKEMCTAVFASDHGSSYDGVTLATQRDWDKYKSRAKRRETGKGRFQRKLQMQYEDQFKKRQALVTAKETKRQNELKIADGRVDELFASFETKKSEMAGVRNMIEQKQRDMKKEGSKTESLREELMRTKRVHDLLEDPEENIHRLEEISERSRSALQNLGVEWEKHRIYFVSQLRDKRADLILRSESSSQKIEEIKEIRATMKSLGAALKEKEGQHRQLLAFYATLPKDLERGMFTDRILSVLDQMKKQQAEIDKILLETKGLMEEIAGLRAKKEEQLDSALAVCEEFIQGKPGKTADQSRKAVRNINELDELFGTLVDTVIQTGNSGSQASALRTKREILGMKMNAIDLDKVLKDLDEIIEMNQTYMTPKERDQREAERKKQKEKAESVNKLEVDPFPECLSDKERLYREYEKRKLREVVEWQNNLFSIQEEYRSWVNKIEESVKQDTFGFTSEEIREYLTVMELKEVEYLKESRSQGEKVGFVWELIPSSTTPVDRNKSLVLLGQTKEIHQKVVDLMGEWKEEQKKAVVDAEKKEEKQRERLQKLKDYRESVAVFQKWVEEKENEAKSDIPGDFQSLLSGFSKLEEGDASIKNEAAERLKSLNALWSPIEESGEYANDPNLANIKPSNLAELSSHLSQLLTERKGKYLKNLFSGFSGAVEALWQKFASFVSLLPVRFKESDLEEMDSAAISSCLSSWEGAKGAEQAKGKELLGAAINCYEKYLKLKKGSSDVGEEKAVYFPENEVSEKNAEIERVLGGYEAALLNKKKSHDRADLFARAEEEWKKYNAFVEKSKESLVVDGVQEMGLDLTYKTLRLWPEQNKTLLAEERELSSALGTSLSTSGSNQKEWEILPSLTICTSVEELKARQEEFQQALRAYDDALDTRKRFHERELCLKDIDTYWAELQKFVDELRESLDLDQLQLKSGAEVGKLYAKWAEGSYQKKGDFLRDKIVGALDLYEEKKDDWIARAGPLAREFVGREEVLQKKQEGDAILEAYDKALTLRKKEHDRAKAFEDINKRWQSYQDFVCNLPSSDPLAELGLGEIEKLLNDWARKSGELLTSSQNSHKGLVTAVDYFENNQGEWEVLEPLGGSVVKKEKINEKQAEAEQKIQEYGDLLAKKKKHHDRQQCVEEIDAKWAKFEEIIATVPPVGRVEEMDGQEVGGLLVQWTRKKAELKGTVFRMHKELLGVVERYETMQGDWAVLEPLDREVIGKNDVEAKKQLLEDYESALVNRQRFHEKDKNMKDLAEKWLEYQDFVASLSTQLLAYAEPLPGLSIPELEELASNWVANQKKGFQSKSVGFSTVLISLINQCPAEDCAMLGIGREAVEETKAECERLMNDYELSLKKKKLLFDREKSIKDISDQWAKYLEFVESLPKVWALEGLAEEELEKLRSSWASSKGALRSQGLSLHRGLLTIRKFYQMKQSEWEVLGECDVVGLEEIEAKKAEFQQLMLSYETALLSRKKITDRAEFLQEIRQKWREYCEFVESLPDAGVVEGMGSGEVNELGDAWRSKKSELQFKASGFYRALLALAAAYQTKQAQWKDLEPLAEKGIEKEEVDKKKEEAEKLINEYENALMGRKNQSERKKYVSDIGTQWASYQEHCCMIQAMFSEENLHDLTTEEIREVHEGWSEEKVKHQSKEASMRRVLLGLIDKCEVAEGSGLLEGVVSKGEVEELQAKSLEVIRIYERALFQNQRAGERKKDLDVAHEELRSYVKWTEEQLNDISKSTQESAGLDLGALNQKNDGIAQEDEQLAKTSIGKMYSVEKKLNALVLASDSEKKEGLMSREERDLLLGKNEGQHERLLAALKARKKKLVLLLKDVQIRGSKEEFRNAVVGFQQWTQESADRLDQTDLSQETIKTLLNFKGVIKEDNESLEQDALKKIKFMEKLWNDGEELGIQSGFTHRIDEVYEAEKVLKEAIKRRNECFAQLERDLHEENMEVLFTEYIEFIEKVHNDMTSSVVEIQLAEGLAGLLSVKKKADQQDSVMRRDHTEKVKGLQLSAGILSRKGYQELSQSEPNDIEGGLALVHEAFQRGEESTEQLQKAAKVFYATVADRRVKLQNRLRELEGLEAVRLWNEKAEALGVWVPKTVAELSEKNDFGANQEECSEFEKVLDREEEELRKELGKKMNEMEKLKEKIDEELHSPAVSFKTVQERAKRVEEAMEKRRKRFMQEKYGYEKEGIIEDFNDNLEAYPQWITKNKKVWDMESYGHLAGNVEKLKIRRDEIVAENEALMQKNDVLYADLASLWEKLEIMEATALVSGNIEMAKDHQKRGHHEAAARLERVNQAIKSGDEVSGYLKSLDEYAEWVEAVITREEASWNKKKAAPFPHSDSIQPVLEKALEFAQSLDQENANRVLPLIEKLVQLEESGLKGGRDPVSHDTKMRAFTQSLRDGWSYFYEKTQEFEKNDPAAENAKRDKWFSLSEKDESASIKKEANRGSSVGIPEQGGDFAENIYTVHLQDDGKVDWAAFGIEPPICQFLYEDEKSVSALRAQITQNLEARTNPDQLGELKKKLAACILVERNKGDSSRTVVLRRRENVDRFQSYAEYPGALYFQEVNSYYNFSIKYTHFTLEPKKNFEVFVMVLDPLNNNQPLADFSGVIALQVIAPDKTEIILENFLPTGQPGEVRLVTSFEKVGSYKGMVLYNEHKVQAQGYAEINIAERKKLFGIF